MEIVVLVAAGAAGLAAGLSWRSARRRLLRARATFESLLDEDAGIAFHVAVHEAETRKQALSSLHLLYGLLQDEAVAGHVTRAGDAGALEDRVLAVLDARPTTSPEENGEAVRMLTMAAGKARYHERTTSTADLWAAMVGTEAAKLVDATGVDYVAVLFALAHGRTEPDVNATTRDVLVILLNDDFSTKEFVRDVLRDVFARPEAEAITTMETAHTQGRAVVGRFAAHDARAKIEEARRRARAAGFPLWITFEAT